MGMYSAFAVVSAKTAEHAAIVHQVFLVRSESPGSAPLPQEELKGLRLRLMEKYGKDLVPVDLEVVEAPQLAARIKKIKR